MNRPISANRPRARLLATLLFALTLTTPVSTGAQSRLEEPPSAEGTSPRPDWIPIGSVSPEVERRAVEAKVRLQSRSPEIQRGALQTIRSDIERYGRAQMRIAAVPLVIELLGLEYRILETPVDYRVDSTIRIDALIILADIGGTDARAQLRDTLRTDVDPVVRVSAAQLLAAVPGDDPDGDLHAVTHALVSAARLARDEGEVRRLLVAARAISRKAWNPEYQPLLDVLIMIASGRYSSSSRSEAMSFLEELADR